MVGAEQHRRDFVFHFPKKKKNQNANDGNSVFFLHFHMGGGKLKLKKNAYKNHIRLYYIRLSRRLTPRARNSGVSEDPHWGWFILGLEGDCRSLTLCGMLLNRARLRCHVLFKKSNISSLEHDIKLVIFEYIKLVKKQRENWIIGRFQ